MRAQTVSPLFLALQGLSASEIGKQRRTGHGPALAGARAHGEWLALCAGAGTQDAESLAGAMLICWSQLRLDANLNTEVMSIQLGR